MSEDKIRDGTGVSFAAGNDPTEIQAQISEIEHRMFSDLNSTHKDEWVSQLSKLYTRLEHARAPRQ